MSFCLRKGDQLYGRYWGSFQIECLHFDACYYAPIEWAIAQGIQTFDPVLVDATKTSRLSSYSITVCTIILASTQILRPYIVK